MLSWIYSCLLIVIAIAYSKANPIQNSAISAFDGDNRAFGSDDLFSDKPKRTGRGGYFYDDFFSFPSEYYNGRYSDYYGSYYDPYYAPQPRPKPRPIAPAPSPLAAYVPYKRRQGFGPTTQKYTVRFEIFPMICSKFIAQNWFTCTFLSTGLGSCISSSYISATIISPTINSNCCVRIINYLIIISSEWFTYWMMHFVWCTKQWMSLFIVQIRSCDILTLLSKNLLDKRVLCEVPKCKVNSKENYLNIN